MSSYNPSKRKLCEQSHNISNNAINTSNNIHQDVFNIMEGSSTITSTNSMNNNNGTSKDVSKRLILGKEQLLHVKDTYDNSHEIEQRGGTKRRKSNDNGDYVVSLSESTVTPKKSEPIRGSGDDIRQAVAQEQQQNKTCEVILPDPKEPISPDLFLQKLVKAQYDCSIKTQPGLALTDFFHKVTDEQMAAYTIELVATVRNNDLPALKKLHSEGQCLSCFNRFGESLLNMGCRRGFVDIVEFMLGQPDIQVRICDDGGRTPLHDACWHPTPQLEICKWLMERDPTLFLIADKRGCTAFQYARPQHWQIWRQFLFDNRELLKPLSDPDNLKRFS